MNTDRKSASAFTIKAMEAARTALPHDDRADFADSRRGLVAPLDPGPIVGSAGPVWDLGRFAATQGEDAACPPTVHPGLWRQRS